MILKLPCPFVPLMEWTKAEDERIALLSADKTSKYKKLTPLTPVKRDIKSWRMVGFGVEG